MDHQDAEMPSPAILADCEAALPEWDRLAVRDYWDAVVAAELGSPVSQVSAPDRAASSIRTAGRAVLHLVTNEQPRVETPFEEAA